MNVCYIDTVYVKQSHVFAKQEETGGKYNNRCQYNTDVKSVSVTLRQ